MKKTQYGTASMVIIIALFLLTSCSGNNVITSAAVLDVEQQQNDVQEPAKTTLSSTELAEIIQDEDAKVVSQRTQYYYVRLSDTAIEPQTIVGYVGKRVLVEIANTGDQDARIVSEDLDLDIIVRPKASYEFEFIPDKERVFYIGDLSRQRRMRVVTLEEGMK